jgi:putative membrane protein
MFHLFIGEIQKKVIVSLITNKIEMDSEKNKDNSPRGKDLENAQTTDLQKKIEEKVADEESSLEGDELSIGLSRDRTHMSEHRTRMSEHRTDMSEHRTDLSEHRTDLSDRRTQLSFQRTALSYERTLMSWIRTSTSMITFGFTIYKFFEEVQKTGHPARFFTPRMVGMCMIAFGFLGLLLAQIQHHKAYKLLREDYPAIQKSLSSVLSSLILVFGLLLFFAVLFRQ